MHDLDLNNKKGVHNLTPKTTSFLGRAWRRATRAMAGACLLASLFSPAATRAQTSPAADNSKPLTGPVLNDTAATCKPAINILDTLGLASLRADFARTPVGKELLDFADKNNIRVIFAAELGDDHLAEYSSEKSTVKLKSDLTDFDRLIFFAHELRHAWQDKTLQYDSLQETFLTPDQRWALMHYVEADAMAYSSYYLAERQNTLGMPSDSASEADDEIRMARSLMPQLKSKDGLQLKEYRDGAMIYAFAHLKQYQHKHITNIQSNNRDFLDRLAAVRSDLNRGFTECAGRTLDRIKEDMSSTTADSVFVVFLRRFGGTSLDPAATTSLQDSSLSCDSLMFDFADRSGKNFSSLYEGRTMIATETKKISNTLEKIRKKEGIHPCF